MVEDRHRVAIDIAGIVVAAAVVVATEVRSAEVERDMVTAIMVVQRRGRASNVDSATVIIDFDQLR